MMNKWMTGVLIAGICAAATADTLLKDTFDRADSSDVNTNSAPNQSGHLAPYTYQTAAYNTADSVDVSQSNVVLNVDGNGTVRLVPQVNLVDADDLIAAAGGFEVTYTVNAGTDYIGSVHGSYLTSLVLGQESIVENASAGSANAFYSLYVKVAGNGQVSVYSQGTLLAQVNNGDYNNAWITGQPNDVRLTVDPDGFTTSNTAHFALSINGSEAVATNFAWQTGSEVFAALEAVNYSSVFDDFRIAEIEPVSPLLFADTFDRADSIDVNAGASANQYGVLSPASYETFSSASGTSSITGQVIRASISGAGARTRVVPQLDISDQSDAILAAGGFSVSCIMDAGVDYPGSVHGTYAGSILLSQESIAENISAATGSAWHSLYAKIAGNGQVRIFLQGVQVFNLVNGDYGNAWLTGQQNSVRVEVETDGFLTGSTNVFTLYINGAEVCSTNFSWKTANDLYASFEAETYSAEFDDLQLRVLESAGALLFSDSFGRADSTNINAAAFVNQSGILAPLSYSTAVNNTSDDAEISANEALLNVDGNGQLRLIPQVDLSDHSAALTENGGFEISCTVESGTDYSGSVHGSYAGSLILSQESIVANAAAGAANVWHGLFVTIKGSGQVQVYSQGNSLLDLQITDWGSAALIDSVNAGQGLGRHHVRLVVETDGFLTTSAPGFTLYINDLFVGSTNFSWKTSSDLNLGLEAFDYSARFDDLEIRKITASAGVTSNGVPYAWLDTYYVGLVTDADYENAANNDTDGDGLTGQEEYLTGTDPTDPDSVFKFTGTVLDPGGLVISWVSESGGLYTVSRTPGLISPVWTPVASNIAGQVDTTSYTATVSEAAGFLKVELQ